MSPRVTLYVQRDTNAPDSSNDDVIRVYEDDDYRDMYRLVYTAPDMQKDSTFYMTKSRVLTYVSDLLKTLSHDLVPFESIQVTTLIAPSVIYHVADLDRPEIRHLIEDSIDTALRNVERS